MSVTPSEPSRAKNANLVACKGFRPTDGALQEILRPFPRARYAALDTYRRRDNHAAWFAHGLIPTTECRWYSLAQLSQSLFAPLDLAELEGVVVAGAQTNHRDGDNLFFTGRVARVHPIEKEGVGNEAREIRRLEIDVLGESLGAKRRLETSCVAGRDYLYSPHVGSFLYALGPQASTGDTLRAVLNGTDFLPSLNSFTDNHPTTLDLDFLLAVLNLIIELPPSFKGSAISKILLGQQIKFKLGDDLRTRYYGFAKGVKKGKKARFPNPLIMSAVGFFSGDYHRRGIFERMELQTTESAKPPSTDPDGYVPDWISLRKLDKDAARILVAYLEGIRARLPAEEVTRSPVEERAILDASRARAMILEQSGTLHAELARAFQAARVGKTGWPQSLNAGLQFRSNDFWDTRRRHTALPSQGFLRYTFGTQTEELFSSGAATVRKLGLWAEVNLFVRADTHVFDHFEITWHTKEE